MTKMPTLAAAVLAAALPAVPSAAVTPVTFAQFFQEDVGAPVSYVAAGGVATITASFASIFTVLHFGTPGIGSALASISATTSAPIMETDQAVLQGGWSGTISFTGGATNLLTVDFVGGNLKVLKGGSQSGSLIVTGTCGASLCYTSDVLDVNDLSVNNFALSFSGISSGNGAPFSKANDTSFVASVSGTFAGAVPEASTWALLLAGFGLIGVAARRRRQSLRTAG